MKNIFFIFCCFLLTLTSKSQTSGDGNYDISGLVIDQTTNEPVAGASVLYEKGKGVTTDANGSFSLRLPNGTYKLRISFIGYTAYEQTVKVENKNISLGHVHLANANDLDEVEVAADIAKTRETPIAFSDIDAKQISEELGANDLPMLLNTTPGAYASQQGGGAGDSRVNIRGFDQRYVAVLVDGVPVNDMENGGIYWSNWSGLAEVTKKVQVQRGLGATRLAVPSVGGVMNTITRSVEDKRFLTVKNDLGTNNYRRIAIGYNSGFINNKFGFTLAGSYTGGDGYVDQTWQKTWSYFFKMSYKINSKNLIVFGFNGSPQSHGQRSYQINMAYNDRTFAMKHGVNADSLYAVPSDPYTNSKAGARGITYSPDWGYVNGKPFTTRINYFHKPLFNLSYFLNINPRLSFSNVLYLSIGTGGGTSLASFGSGYDPAGTGQLYLQGIYNSNSSAVPNPLIPNLRPSSNYQYSSINNHKWVGTLATIKYKASSKIDFLGGLDARYYTGQHYQTPYDYMGGDYVIAPAQKDLNQLPMNQDPTSYIKKIGDKINYDYDSKITWLGLFSEMEYKNDRVSGFVTLTGNQTSYQEINYFAKKDIVLDKNNIIYNAVGAGDTLYYDGKNYGVSPTNYANPSAFAVTHNPDGTITFYDVRTSHNVTLASNYKAFGNQSAEARTNTTKLKTYGGYTAKGGLSYKLDRNHNVFANVGYMDIAPKFTNVFSQAGLEVGNVKNQQIITGELGYGIKYSQVAININAYMTKWSNKPLDYAAQITSTLSQDPIFYNIPGADALMKGIEMDLNYKPNKNVEAQLFGMVADWRWNSGATAYVTDQAGQPIDTVVFDATGVHVGNAPQRQLGGSIRFNFLKGFYIKPQYIYFDKMYAQFDPTNLQVTKGPGAKDYTRQDSWRMPGYGLLNLFLGYTITAQNGTLINIMATMNNVLNTVYITDATFASTTAPSSYNALNSYGWMGMGRRFTVSVKVTF